MPGPGRLIRWTFGLIVGGAVCAAGVVGYWSISMPKPRHTAAATAGASAPTPVTDTASDDSDEPPPAVIVEAVHPKPGDMDRTTSQPGSVQSFESAQLYAGVSGYLKTQTVDIGDRVKRGQVLATVDVPDLDKKVQRFLAGVEQAQARVAQMRARIVTASADADAAAAAITFAEANNKSKAAEARFRQKQLDRMKELFALKSIDERLVDERTEQRDSAHEAENAAIASVISAKAQASAARAKIQQAEADLGEAQAQVRVAQADLEKEQVMVTFATISAPFDGVVTHRALFPGDFVKAADGGGGNAPLLTVQRTDKFRIVVQIPDRDVPFADPGDPATVELDALPDETFVAKVSRVAGTEDQQTRLMRIEIDLPNIKGRIRQGMYGRVTIVLERSDLLSVPASALVDRADGGRAAVFVVRDGVARKVAVRTGADNGIKVGVASGLTAADLVIRRPPAGLADGATVAISSPDAAGH